MWPSCAGQNCFFINFLWEKQGYGNSDNNGSPPSPLLKIHRFFHIKHLHSTWVADASSFHSGSVRNHPLLICTYLNVANAFSCLNNYFQTRIIKTVLGKTMLGEGLLFPICLIIFNQVYTDLCSENWIGQEVPGQQIALKNIWEKESLIHYCEAKVAWGDKKTASAWKGRTDVGQHKLVWWFENWDGWGEDWWGRWGHKCPLWVEENAIHIFLNFWTVNGLVLMKILCAKD